MYQYLLPIFLLYFIILIILITIIYGDIHINNQISQIKRTHKIGNIMFTLLNTILIIPFSGISINVLYCNKQNNIYTYNSECYTGQHIGYCFIAGIVMLLVVISSAIYWFVYFNKNPFSKDFLAKYSNNQVLGKFIIKILPIIYLSIDGIDMKYVNIFVVGHVALLCGYIFFFRIYSIHDYNEFTFYFSLSLQVFLGWFTINNLILYYLDSSNKAGGIIQAFFCSILISVVIIQFQQQNYKKYSINIDKYDNSFKQYRRKNQLNTLIRIFNSKRSYNTSNSKQSENVDNKQKSKNTIVTLKYLPRSLKTFNQLKTKQQYNKVISQQQKQSDQQTQFNQQRFLIFLKRLLLQHQQQNTNCGSNIMLMIIKCQLLLNEDRYSFAFQQCIQMWTSKINISDQLMLYRFRRHPRYDIQRLDLNKKQKNNMFMMYSDFNRNLMKMESLISTCALNNLEYWQELCQLTPSIFKVRNLAYKYQQLQSKIQSIYHRIIDVFPNNKYTIKSYIQYLIYVGINVKSLSLSYEKYQLAQQSLQKSKEHQKSGGNIIKMTQNQNLAYVSLQTNQINFGNINNCNSQFKQLLGYQKNQLIDKKIHKLMPKAFSQFHDVKMKNFIQKRQINNKNKVQRNVYALTKNNFLKQVVLFTEVSYKNIGEKPGLQLIAFIKNIQNPKKAMILLDMNTQNITGVNMAFSKLIQNGINTSQYMNNQIKIFSLFPSFNMQKLSDEQNQETQLIFSSSIIGTRSHLDLDIKKKVKIQIQQIRQYSQKSKLAYLIVKTVADKPIHATMNNLFIANDNKNKSDVSLKQEQNSNRRLYKKISFEKNSSQVSIMQQYKKRHVRYSINLTKQQLQSECSSSSKEQQQIPSKHLLIQRKKQQFLKNQYIELYKYLLLAVTIFFLLTIGIFTSVYLLNSNRALQSLELKDQIKQVNVLNYRAASINVNTQKLAQTKNYSQIQYSQNKNKLSQSLSDFQQNFIPLMTKAVVNKQPLQLNQFKFYNIIIQKNSTDSVYATNTIIDIFFQYIQSGKNFLSYSYSSLINIMNIKQLLDSNIFIQQNGKGMFSSILQNMAVEYIQLDRKLSIQHQSIKITFDVVYSVIFILTLGSICLLLKNINKFNQNVVNLYRQIKLWDVTEMKSKCIKFMEIKSINGIRFNTQRRFSSLMSVFPQELIAKVLDQNILKSMKNQRKQQHRLSIFSKKLSHEESNLSKSAVSFNHQFHQKTQLLKPQKVITSKLKIKKNYIYLDEKNKLKKKLIILSIACCIFIVMFFLRNQITTIYEKDGLEINQKLNQLGKVRSNLAFINYYSYQIMLKPDDEDFRMVLRKQISNFYTNTDSCYGLIGDPSKILKSSYNMVQQISALIFSQNSLNLTKQQRYSIRNPKYLQQQASFSQNIKQITKIIQNNLQIKAQQICSNILSINILYIVALIIIIFIFVFVIKSWMLQQIVRNSNKSKAMVEMLPPWLIERNKKLLNIFNDQNKIKINNSITKEIYKNLVSFIKLLIFFIKLLFTNFQLFYISLQLAYFFKFIDKKTTDKIIQLVY